MSAPYLLFLHGINSSQERDWLEPLNEAISWFGFEPFADDRVITPDYRSALQGKVGLDKAAPTTWKRPPEQELRTAQTEYLVTAAALERRIRGYADGWDVPLQPPLAPAIPKIGGRLEEARQYARDETVRNAVWDTVLRSLTGPWRPAGAGDPRAQPRLRRRQGRPHAPARRSDRQAARHHRQPPGGRPHVPEGGSSGILLPVRAPRCLGQHLRAKGSRHWCPRTEQALPGGTRPTGHAA